MKNTGKQVNFQTNFCQAAAQRKAESQVENYYSLYSRYREEVVQGRAHKQQSRNPSSNFQNFNPNAARYTLERGKHNLERLILKIMKENIY